MRWLAVIALAGCGRIAFDARDDGSIDSGDGPPQTYRELVISDGPLAYWRLAPFSTTTIDDEMGMFPGTRSGLCADASGLLQKDTNRAIGFDGATCQVDIPGMAGRFAGTQNYSIEAWIEWDGGNVSGNYEHVFTCQERSSGPVNGIALAYQELVPPGIFSERTVSTTNSGTSMAAISANTTAYAVATYDGSTLTLYMDGVARSSTGAMGVIPAYLTHAFIGAGPDTGGVNYFSGVIDEVAVYDHPLSPSQVMQHYQFGTNPP